MQVRDVKILVLSNVAGSVDKVVEVVNEHHNVVAKETNSGTNTLAQNVGEQLRNGVYEAAIVIARDPIGAGMLLNKQDGVEAAVCGSVEDVQMAKANGANVIVIRNIDSDALQEIVGQAVGSGGMLRGMKLDMKMPRLPTKSADKGQTATKPSKPSAMPSAPAKASKKTAEPEEEEEPEEEDTMASSGEGKGMMGKIKDFLGVT